MEMAGELVAVVLGVAVVLFRERIAAAIHRADQAGGTRIASHGFIAALVTAFGVLFAITGLVALFASD